MAAVWLLALATTVSAADKTEKRFRYGVTRQMFGGVEENDFRAAIKIYIESVGEDRGVTIDVPETFDRVEEVGEALRTGNLDGASMTTQEYFQVRADIASVHIFDEPTKNEPGEQYILLVRSGNNALDLGNLKGGTLVQFDNLRTSLSRMWLDVQLLERGLPAADSLFEKITRENKLSRAVLPVFFGKAKACLVTREGFDTMKELNPQVGERLTPVLLSEYLVPAVMCFGRMADQSVKVDILKGIERLHEQPRGQQLITVFQGGDRMQQFPETFLERGATLRDRYIALKARRPEAAPAGTPPPQEISQ